MKTSFFIAILCVYLIAGAYGCSKKVPSSAPAKPVAALPPASAAPPHVKPYKALGQWYQPLPHARGFMESGLASWYGEDFHGKRTSNGEIYDMYAESAAHKTLPLGTIVRVKNLNNNREMEIRINDRGPFVAGRIIDLSYACAKKLDIVRPGTAPVEIVAIGMTDSSGINADTPDFYYKGNFTIQVGAFRERANAERLRANLEKTYQNAHIQIFENVKGVFYRVRVTSSSDLEKAIQQEKMMISNGFREAFVVAE